MPAATDFRHEALLYPGPTAFLDRVAPFVEAAVDRGQPIMVALEAGKLRALRDRLGDGADQVVFADMGELGRNPARIIPAWREFVDANEGRATVRHGGGSGTLRIWDDAEGVICEVRDTGHIDEPLAGRVRPQYAAARGWGLWLANQLCDLVQIRSRAEGIVVRLHMHRA